ncbi:MAG: MarR family transcriptional regulator [Bacteroidota bacterium]
MDILSELGALAIASRMKRMSEAIMRSGAEVYRYYGVDFEPKWFAVYYCLSEKGELGIMEIAEMLKLTHPAVIQLAKELEKKGLIGSKKSVEDARKRKLKLSKKGLELLPKMQKIWEEIRLVNTKIIENQEHNLLTALEDLENSWAEKDYLSHFTKFDFEVELKESKNIKIKEQYTKRP